jgi:hypothetical protein
MRSLIPVFICLTVFSLSSQQFARAAAVDFKNVGSLFMKYDYQFVQERQTSPDTFDRVNTFSSRAVQVVEDANTVSVVFNPKIARITGTCFGQFLDGQCLEFSSLEDLRLVLEKTVYENPKDIYTKNFLKGKLITRKKSQNKDIFVSFLCRSDRRDDSKFTCSYSSGKDDSLQLTTDLWVEVKPIDVVRAISDTPVDDLHF